ncbi:hypothetical protein Axy14_025 [Achromobacter phage vB_AxyS_19-32_Axy14]|nr:hypothetical protein Axy14_025 [Achromobacter phage vB_AxyS_19-32_Axy14]
MIIKLSPICWDRELAVSKAGDALTINGEVFDFSQLPDGSLLPQAAINCEFIIGDVKRQDGVLTIPLLLPHAIDASEAARFPEDMINPADGLLELPQ